MDCIQDFEGDSVLSRDLMKSFKDQGDVVISERWLLCLGSFGVVPLIVLVSLCIWFVVVIALISLSDGLV